MSFASTRAMERQMRWAVKSSVATFSKTMWWENSTNVPSATWTVCPSAKTTAPTPSRLLPNWCPNSTPKSLMDGGTFRPVRTNSLTFSPVRSTFLLKQHRANSLVNSIGKLKSRTANSLPGTPFSGSFKTQSSRDTSSITTTNTCTTKTIGTCWIMSTMTTKMASPPLCSFTIGEAMMRGWAMEGPWCTPVRPPFPTHSSPVSVRPSKR
mmetsp:Transcript_16688/g.30352  ORF Transcript_16688/g.30352 Transcript_16688/m.30352 type:complete len:209 (+) Transcript_16688:617-1243(+)